MALLHLSRWLRWTREGAKDPKERRRNKRTVPKAGSAVLVVDDSKTVRSVLRKMLQQGGFEVLEAADGKAAVEQARAHRPDLIIMDVVMPNMNGFQATRKLRKARETRAIPIVIMSGNKQATQEFWVIRIGANDFMAKPFNRFEVYRRIERILYNNLII
jgi:twitching motility two-component system response regulator PilH